MDMRKIIITLILACGFVGIKAQSCEIHNSFFKPGEQITYKIYYHWHFVWLESGEVTFGVAEHNYQGIPSYYFTGMGHSYPKYDWFFQVRDTFRAYVDTFGFAPLRFTRYSNEGSNHIHNDNLFDNLHHKVLCFSHDMDNNYKRDSVNIPACTFDPLSGIYFTRSLDFSKAKVNDTVPITLYLDNHVYHIHIKYLGKEEEETQFGKFRCNKLSVSLISGTIFEQGEEMTVWVTDDNNRLPLYIEAPIIIGSVRVELLSFSNLKNPMDAKVK
ncbi:MAG TPA: DUF3108 domain-containing protein [Bacteroidia bacterium]|jgi:hypothetical protein|nr:DUF3108 domain-containing protein [Bacteroidia bacterium]